MRRWSRITIGIFCAVALVGLMALSLMREREVEPLKTDVLTIGTEKFSVEIVQTPALRARGLGGREELCERCGMLFLFDDADLHAFWMKDMRFSLDILWIQDGVVVDSVQKISPNDPRTFMPSTPAGMVVEFSGGTMERLHLRHGMAVSLEK
ncbi:MAG TPA: DUF192 domain-containing protein [Patescibacteria group bacterium]|nr:DUF192 domain-containing protein [Patescibacteria group bacterium]